MNCVCLYHTRKAGGTSLRRYTKTLSEEKGVAIQVVEGPSIRFANYFARAHNQLHLISLREPVYRIKSSYRFEGRWQQLAKTRVVEDAIPFSQWVKNVNQMPKNDDLWVCVWNYYVKALMGYPRHGKERIGRNEFELAKQVLQCFDVILITELMSDEQTSRYLRDKLDFSITMPTLRFPTAAESPSESDDDIFDEKTLREIKEDNFWDSELYEYAKRLSLHRMKAFAGRPDIHYSSSTSN